MQELKFFQDLAIILTVAGIAGWLFQRIRLSATSGYLLAGVLLGPAGVIPLVSNSETLRLLSQFGLIFLMFSIGQNLGIKQIRRTGLVSLISTGISTILIFTCCRLLGRLLGLDDPGSLLLAGLFISSSSVIIGRILHDSGHFHRPYGQAAMFQTLLEDFNVIILLSLLGSALLDGSSASSPVLQALGTFASFVVLIAILALLFIPRVLHLLQQKVSPELRNVIMAAILVGTAVMARSAGYSFALGAFIMGMAMAGTPDRPQIEKAFSGLSDLFGAVFFVSIGMLINLQHLLSAWPLILLFTALAVFGRSFACTIGQLMVGRNQRDAVMTGLLLIPIGELSFLITQIGIDAGQLPESFGAVIVGVSILSTIAASMILPVSGRIADSVVARQPKWILEALTIYQNGLNRTLSIGSSNRVWKIYRKCLLRIFIEVLFVTGMMIFSSKLYAITCTFSKKQGYTAQSINILFWMLFGLLILVILLAIWRNIEVLILILAELTGRKYSRPDLRISPRIIEQILRVIALVLLSTWLWLCLPFTLSGFWSIVGLTAVSAVCVGLLWKPMVQLHSMAETHFQYSINLGAKDSSALIFRHDSNWDLNIEEVLIPQSALCCGHSLAKLNLRNRFGCSILGVERQGMIIDAPGADFTIFPQDLLLLLGEPTQIPAARTFLKSTGMMDSARLDDIHLDTILIPESSSFAELTLAQWNIAGKTGVQIAALRRPGQQITTPAPSELLHAGDELLVLGTAKKIRDLKIMLASGSPAAPDEASP